MVFVTSVRGQGVIRDERADPNYMYAAVLGSGFYTVGDASLTMLRVPFKLTLREANDEDAKLNLLLPVVIGYVSLDPTDVIDRWVPTNLGTLSFFPGVEWEHQVREDLVVKPFAQIGGGYDFESSIWSGLVAVGSRFLWTKQLTNEWQWQVGSSLQWASGWQESGLSYSSFGLLELGTDIQRELPWRLREKQLLGSLYGRVRYFANNWNIARSPDDPIDVDLLYELGMSLGVDKGYELYGIEMNRVSIGFVWGGDARAVSVGTSFPF
ncbi:hypothetical protein [Rubritalea marina]|uniref:hypothetical protein n=1 Tax=Rubritalea marina TaxID=361055 RepID=UPI0003A47714|nr:hypothetical protein [Rubritalea marina]